MSSDFSHAGKKISPFGERLLGAFGNASKGKIASVLGVANSAVTNYLQGRVPDAALLERISNFTNCSIHWLVTGKGSRRIIDDREAGLIDLGHLKSIIRDVVREELEDVGGEVGPIEPLTSRDVMLAPHLGEVGGGEDEEELPRRRTG